MEVPLLVYWRRIVLCPFQIRAVLRNKTQIEDWICDKAIGRRKRDPNLQPFVYPYDLGWKRNFTQVDEFEHSIIFISIILRWLLFSGSLFLAITLINHAIYSMIYLLTFN